jgi:hypothetical protein
MNIISHRGYWKTEDEKNQLNSFNRSFKLGFGVETDVRDYRGQLVISHDIPDASSISLDVFFELYSTNRNSALTLALNIKSDGLQLKLKNKLIEFGIENYFVFDMSIPESLGYLKKNITIFSRHSEYEPIPSFFSECEGIWLDSFLSRWFDYNLIFDHVEKGKKVAIVSPELHKRNHLQFWEYLKINKLHLSENIMLCTDFPEDANNFFKN